MSFYGYNRAAFNSGVSGIVAGAALLLASSGLLAQGVRVVLPDSAVVATSNFSATSIRTAFGDGGFIATSTLTAIPGLLQLQSAHIDVVSALKGVNTEARSASTVDFRAEGTLTQAGSAGAPGVLIASAVPLVDVGFASNVFLLSDCTADAGVQRSGTVGYQLDGYARTAWTVGFTADSLRTALGYIQTRSYSALVGTGIKTHGGLASVDVVWSTIATAATDAAYSNWVSDVVAQGVITRPGQASLAFGSDFQATATATIPGESVVDAGSLITAEARLALLGQALLTVDSTATAAPDRTAFGATDVSCVATATADARLALLAVADINTTSAMESEGRLALLAVADINTTSMATAAGIVFENGFAEVLFGTSSLTAIPARLINAQAAITATSTCRSSSLVNAGAPDPDIRVMRRSPQDRVMARFFTDRLMRRAA